MKLGMKCVSLVVCESLTCSVETACTMTSLYAVGTTAALSESYSKISAEVNGHTSVTPLYPKHK